MNHLNVRREQLTFWWWCIFCTRRTCRFKYL